MIHGLIENVAFHAVYINCFFTSFSSLSDIASDKLSDSLESALLFCSLKWTQVVFPTYLKENFFLL